MSTNHNDDTDKWRPSSFRLLTLMAMLPWPLLGFVAALSLLNDPSEVSLLFGGFSALLLLPLYMLFGMHESTYGIVIVIMWLFLWIVPSIGFNSLARTRREQLLFASILSLVSFAQTVMGVLIIFGKEA